MECYTGKWFEARGISYMFSVIIRVTNNSVSQDYPHPDDHVKHITHQSIWTPGMEGTFTQCECECQWSSWTPGQKHWVKSPPLGTQLYKPKSCMCRIGSDSRSLNVQRKTMWLRATHTYKIMWSVQITKWRENLAAGKSNVNPPLILTYWAKKWKRVFILPPRETQAGEYEVIISATLGVVVVVVVRGGGFK